ncbi:MAG: hypothetical protein B6I22_08450 [Desulfobacteraceae bacterium 4572_123]|nr:MAG: hypothetical protein B6I22_08450 [Desulfobacteraceae bacterium 4572_123]
MGLDLVGGMLPDRALPDGFHVNPQKAEINLKNIKFHFQRLQQYLVTLWQLLLMIQIIQQGNSDK